MEDTFRGVGSFSKNATDFVRAGVYIFSEPTVEQSSKFCRESVHRPISENPDGPYEFYLPAENNTYIDCEGFRLSGYVSIVKIKDGAETALKEADDAAPINFLPGAAWTMKELFYNGALVNYVTQPFDNIKSYIETKVSYGTDISNSILQGTSLWLDDSGDYGVAGASNANHKTRAALFYDNKKNAFSIPLQLDVLNTDRFLPNNLDLNIRLTKANNKFLVNSPSDEDFRVKFHDLKLTSRRITISDSVLKDHESRFRSGQEAIFPFVRTDIKVYNIPIGSSEARTNSIYRKKIPTSAIIAFADNEALSGNTKKNPLSFAHNDITEVSFYCNSEKICTYQQNYHDSDYAIAYRRFQDEIGVRTNNIGNAITAKEWASHFNIYPFDFSPDKCLGYHDHLDLSGNLDFVVRFKTVTTKVLSMIILTHYDDQIRLDEARNVVNRGNPTEIV